MSSMLATLLDVNVRGWNVVRAEVDVPRCSLEPLWDKLECFGTPSCNSFGLFLNYWYNMMSFLAAAIDQLFGVYYAFSSLSARLHLASTFVYPVPLYKSRFCFLARFCWLRPVRRLTTGASSHTRTHHPCGPDRCQYNCSEVYAYNV